MSIIPPQERRRETINYINENIFLNLFCQDCLMIPKYQIIISKKGMILLSHECEYGRNKRIKFSMNNINNKMTKTCYYCGNICNIICLKCRRYLCNECINCHIPTYLRKKRELDKFICFQKKTTYFCSIYESRFFLQ